MTKTHVHGARTARCNVLTATHVAPRTQRHTGRNVTSTQRRASHSADDAASERPTAQRRSVASSHRTQRHDVPQRGASGHSTPAVCLHFEVRVVIFCTNSPKGRKHTGAAAKPGNMNTNQGRHAPQRQHLQNISKELRRVNFYFMWKNFSSSYLRELWPKGTRPRSARGCPQLDARPKLIAIEALILEAARARLVTTQLLRESRTCDPESLH